MTGVGPNSRAPRTQNGGHTTNQRRNVYSQDGRHSNRDPDPKECRKVRKQDISSEGPPSQWDKLSSPVTPRLSVSLNGFQCILLSESQPPWKDCGHKPCVFRENPDQLPRRYSEPLGATTLHDSSNCDDVPLSASPPLTSTILYPLPLNVSCSRVCSLDPGDPPYSSPTDRSKVALEVTRNCRHLSSFLRPIWTLP